MKRYDTIDPQFFINNRNRLIKKLKPNSIAIVSANFQMPRNGDQYYPYRQNSDFFYLTGIEQEKSVLILAPDAFLEEHKEILFIIKSNETLEIWEGHKLTFPEASELSGIKNIRTIDDFDSLFHLISTSTENIYLNIPETPKFQAEVESRDLLLARTLKNKYPAHQFERLAPILHLLRLYKTSTEIDLIKKAISITNDAFLNVLKGLKPGMKEFEVEAILSYEFIRSGAQNHAYAPIIASGKNACTLHYIENNNICRDGDLVLMDFGAEFANYAADLSRTIPVNGKFTQRQLDLYNATLRVLKIAQNLMKPGISINEIQKDVCRCFEEEHIRLGLYSKDDIKDNKDGNPLCHKYFMHGVSHFLGLDVHDVGTREIILEDGMVITCEPGIYIPEEGIGIRLENNILITQDGNINLMNDIPIEAEEIENLMNIK